MVKKKPLPYHPKIEQVVKQLVMKELTPEIRLELQRDIAAFKKKLASRDPKDVNSSPSVQLIQLFAAAWKKTGEKQVGNKLTQILYQRLATHFSQVELLELSIKLGIIH